MIFHIDQKKSVNYSIEESPIFGLSHHLLPIFSQHWHNLDDEKTLIVFVI